MFDENQLVTINVNNKNRDRLLGLGYTIPDNKNEQIAIKAKHLRDSSGKKVIAICDYCGREYQTSYFSIVKGYNQIVSKHACKNCAAKKAVEISFNRRMNTKFDKLIDVCKHRGYTLVTDRSEYTDCKMDIRFICPKHGIQIMSLDNLLHNHECKSCSYEKRGKNLRNDIEFVKQEIASIDGQELLNPEEYISCTDHNLKIRCQCGNVFETSFVNYKKHGVIHCSRCSHKESYGEREVRKYLELNNIPFIQEKRFDDCRDVKPLPFDFYLTDLNTIIEFDGKGHYEKNTMMDYDTLKKHDDMKDKYCEDNNITIIRIPFWERQNIAELLNDKLKQVEDIV